MKNVMCQVCFRKHARVYHLQPWGEKHTMDGGEEAMDIQYFYCPKCGLMFHAPMVAQRMTAGDIITPFSNGGPDAS